MSNQSISDVDHDGDGTKNIYDSDYVPMQTGESVYGLDELHIDIKTVAKIAFSLINVALLRPGFLLVNQSLNELNNNTELKAIADEWGSEDIQMKSQKWIDHYDFSNTTGGIPEDIEHIHSVGNAFMDMLREIQGFDQNNDMLTYAWMLQNYDGQPGIQLTEVISITSQVLAVASIAAVAATTGGAAIPGLLVRGLALAGAGTNVAGHLLDPNLNGPEKSAAVFLDIFVGWLGGAGGNQTLINALNGTATQRRLGQFLTTLENRTEIGIDFAADHGLGLITNLHDSDLETMYQIIHEETGIDIETIRTSLEPGMEQMRQEALRRQSILDQYRFNVDPSATHNTAIYDGQPGPLELPLEIVPPQSANAAEQNINITKPGEYSKSELEELLGQYPDFTAWLQAREADYIEVHGSNPPHGWSFLQAVNEEGIWQHIDVPITDHYVQLTWAFILLNQS